MNCSNGLSLHVISSTAPRSQMVESSVNATLTPLINWLPVNQLDQFLCRQLDKVFIYHNQYRSPSTSSTEQSSLSISDNLKSKELSAEKNVPKVRLDPNFALTI